MLLAEEQSSEAEFNRFRLSSRLALQYATTALFALLSHCLVGAAGLITVRQLFKIELYI